jgi:DNA-binding response OmpR family regulator
VDTADDGDEAVRKLSAIRPHVILFDLRMPEWIGAAIRRAQLADIRLRSVPVVMYSARDAVGGARHGRREWRSNYFDRLIALLRQHCGDSPV